jgi:hypothetical protein
VTASRVTDVIYTPASADLRATGLLGFVRFTVGGTLRLDGVAVRRSQEGFMYLAFPARGPKREHPLVQPTSSEARRALEQAVFEALGVEEPGP